MARNLYRPIKGTPVTKPKHQTYNPSEKLWDRSGGDWKIDHAGKASEAQETEQSAECIARDSLTLDALSAGVKQYGAGVTRVMILERSVSGRDG